MLVDNFCHVGRRLNHAVHLLYITVLTGDVAFNHLLTVHPSLVDIVGLMVGQHIKVGTGNLVDLHIRRQEMDHRC